MIYVMNIAAAAKLLHEQCDKLHCTVSFHVLRETAVFLSSGVDEHEQDEVTRLIEAMPL